MHSNEREKKDLLITHNVMYTHLCDCALKILSTKSEQLDTLLDRQNTHTSCSPQRLYGQTLLMLRESLKILP